MIKFNAIGYDIILDENGDFQPTPSGDIFTATDESNLIQAIKNRIVTEKGDIIYNTDYGINYNLFFTKKTKSAITAIKSSIIREISQDPRIKKIMRVDIFTSDDVVQLRTDQILVEVELVPINKDEIISINFVYPNLTSPSFSNNITSEPQKSTDKSTVYVNHIIKSVRGVYLVGDTEKTGTNFYLNGSFYGRKITLGSPLNINIADLIVDYTTYDTTMNGIDVKPIENEIITTSSNQILVVANEIYDVAGVYLLSDTNKNGTNYWFDIVGDQYSTGSFEVRDILLAKILPIGQTFFDTVATELAPIYQTTLDVYDTSGFRPNHYALIDKGLETQEFMEIKEINGNTITFFAPLGKDHSSTLATVELNVNQLLVDYSTIV